MITIVCVYGTPNPKIIAHGEPVLENIQTVHFEATDSAAADILVSLLEDSPNVVVAHVA